MAQTTAIRNSWWQTATCRAVVVRALGYSVVVGSILTAINQGDLILYGAIESKHIWKICLTYAVPYVVSTLSSVGTLRSMSREFHSESDG